MPTGYTHGVQDGKVTELNDFVIKCAGAMGACIMQRDDGLDAGIKFDEPSNCYSERILDAEASLLHYKSAGREEWVKEYEESIQRTRDMCEEALENKVLGKQRYQDMLDKVKLWNPPSPDHEGLKSFMIEQLENSISHDCDCTYYEDQLLTIGKQSPDDWFEETVSGLERDVVSCGKMHAEDVKRCTERNLWKTLLINSLRDCEL